MTLKQKILKYIELICGYFTFTVNVIYVIKKFIHIMNFNYKSYLI